jgi:hypothetical protein
LRWSRLRRDSLGGCGVLPGSVGISRCRCGGDGRLMLAAR